MNYYIMACPYANMSKSELKQVAKALHKQRSRVSLGIFSDESPSVHQFKCAFCGLVHDKIELGGFSMGYPTSLKIEDDFALNLKGSKNSIIKGKVYKE